MKKKSYKRKAASVVHIVSITLIVLSTVSSFFMYILYKSDTLGGLVSYLVLALVSICLIILPSVLQRTLKLYIPSFLEIMLSVYLACNTFIANIYQVRTSTLEFFLPVFGGAVISMLMFAIFYSLLAIKFDPNPLLVALITFASSVIVVIAWELVELLIDLLFFLRNDVAIDVSKQFIEIGFYLGGCFVFSIVSAFLVYYGQVEVFRIRSLRNLSKAKETAEATQNKGLAKAIVRTEKDTTNYRKIYLSAKSKFLIGRLFYHAIYIAYLAYLIIFYYRERAINYILIILLVVAFVLSASISVYEYFLFRRNEQRARLYIMKFVKNVIRILALALTFAVLLQADYELKPTTVLMSAIMFFVNLIFCFTNMHKNTKVKKEQNAPSLENSYNITE